jgi:exonuclease 3'-5' domain-containing protein 1
MTMPTVVFISTTEELSSLLATLVDLPVSPPSLYIDLEGAKLSRNGTIALLTLYVPPKETVYLIDIHMLGAGAFSTPAAATIATTIATTPLSTTLNIEDLSKDARTSAITFKSILESPRIPKVFFDVRNDSDALFSHYAISLSCIHDIQLMELATTTRAGRDYLLGLSKAIEFNASRLNITPKQMQDGKAIKEAGIKLFAPERGGRYTVFEDRPLSEAIKNYCVQDVVHMPGLWKLYGSRMTEGGFWWVMATEGAARRVDESHQANYRPNGQHKSYGCWSTTQIKEATRRWNAGKRSNLC